MADSRRSGAVALGVNILLLLTMIALAACGRNPGPEGSPAVEASRGGADLRVLTAAEIDAQPTVSSVAQLLATMPGVLIGGAAGVQLAGRGGTPLFVVNGVPSSDARSALSLNPRDISRIEVVTDAGALSAYGMRGGNGAVLIETRR